MQSYQYTFTMFSLQAYTHPLGFTAFIIVFGSSFLFGYNIGVLNQIKDVSFVRVEIIINESISI